MEPIILHRDAVSGGGYAMVGTVISADLVVPRHTRLRLRLPAGEHVVRASLGKLGAAGTVDLGSLHGHLTLRATVGR